MSGATELLSSLEAVGVRVTLNAAGDGLKVKADIQPPADLLARIRAAKPALLEALGGVPSPHALPAGDSRARTCGTCARWSAQPAPLAHMGVCSAGRAAHGWHDGNPAAPVEIQAGCGCLANDGQGYRAGFSNRHHTPPVKVPTASPFAVQQ